MMQQDFAEVRAQGAAGALAGAVDLALTLDGVQAGMATSVVVQKRVTA